MGKIYKFSYIYDDSINITYIRWNLL